MAIGRNDPCPCGSGKKYKKCCMPASGVVSLQQFRDKRTSDALLDRLATYVGSEPLMDEATAALHRFFGGRPPENPAPEDKALLMDWLMFHYRSSQLGTSLCEHFASKAGGLTREDRDLAAGWAMAQPGFFRVLTVQPHQVSLRRLGDEQTFVINAGGTDITQGELVLASLLPVPSGYRVGMSLFSIPSEVIQPLEHLLKEELGMLRRQRPTATWDDLYRFLWPRLIDDARYAETRGEALLEIQFGRGPAVQGEPVDDAKWQAVADRLVQEMAHREAGPEETAGGLRLWWDAVHALKPKVTKVEAWVAGVLYVLSNRIYSTQMTQDAVAELMGTSATTVGARARQIEGVLHVEQCDPRYADLLSPSVLANWRLDCLTLTKEGRRDFRALRAPLFEDDYLDDDDDDDPELDDADMFRALDLVDLAWQAQGKRRVELARKALELWPDTTDAYVILGSEAMERKELHEARRYYEEGIRAAERNLQNEDEDPFYWPDEDEGDGENGPYARARHGLADCLWLLGEREAAIAQFEEMLSIDPTDAQGRRFSLASRLLELDDHARLGKLCAAYAEDKSAAMLYTRALYEFRAKGPDRAAERWLTDALKANPHVPAYILQDRPLPKQMAESVRAGDEPEAQAYAYMFINRWQETPGALEWLTTQTRR